MVNSFLNIKFLSCAVTVAWYKNLKLTIDYIWRNIFVPLNLFKGGDTILIINLPVTSVTLNEDVTG